MEIYWALDFIDDELGECELVCDNQLYATEEEAYHALSQVDRPDCFEVNWYSRLDLEEDIYGREILIDQDLVIHPLYL